MRTGIASEGSRFKNISDSKLELTMEEKILTNEILRGVFSNLQKEPIKLLGNNRRQCGRSLDYKVEVEII